MSNLTNRSSEISVDIVELIDLVEKLGLSDDDFMFPERFEKFKYVAEYLKKVEHKNFFIRRVVQSELNDKLQKIFEYCQLAEQRDRYDEDYRNTLEEKNRLFGDNYSEEPEFIQLSSRLEDTKRKVSDIDNEMRIYEK